ncbi:MAG: hypothetical protein KAG18_01815 [Sinobacterium sp.]|nr:hypothetical protein [Sinobacterium sp.]
MNLHASSHFSKTQDNTLEDALLRAEALLKKLEKKLEHRAPHQTSEKIITGHRAYQPVNYAKLDS